MLLFIIVMLDVGPDNEIVEISKAYYDVNYNIYHSKHYCRKWR
jgi:hypothetical protein